MSTSITPLTPVSFCSQLERFISIYIEAMQYPSSLKPLVYHNWIDTTELAHFTAFSATAPPSVMSKLLHRCHADQPLGFCFGFQGNEKRAWHHHVETELCNRGITTDALTNYAELSELHVLPSAQKQGLGANLLAKFIQSRSEHTILLSTPEVEDRPNGAWKLYRAFGFTDLLRNVSFPGDQREFAILQLDNTSTRRETSTA